MTNVWTVSGFAYRTKSFKLGWHRFPAIADEKWTRLFISLGWWVVSLSYAKEV